MISYEDGHLAYLAITVFLAYIAIMDHYGSLWITMAIYPMCIFPDVGSGKLEARAEEACFVGVDEESKGYRVYWPTRRRISVERNVSFVPSHQVGTTAPSTSYHLPQSLPPLHLTSYNLSQSPQLQRRPALDLQ